MNEGKYCWRGSVFRKARQRQELEALRGEIEEKAYCNHILLSLLVGKRCYKCGLFISNDYEIIEELEKDGYMA